MPDLTDSTLDGRQPASHRTIWEVDPRASTVGFSIRHLSIATVSGAFDSFQGVLETGPSGLRAARGTVAAASLYTGDRTRDQVLLGSGFLDAESHGEITFTSDQIDVAGPHVRVVGKLTIRGVQRQIELKGTVERATGSSGEELLRLAALGTISRKDFGVTGGGLIERVGAALGDRVMITVELSAVRR